MTNIFFNRWIIFGAFCFATNCFAIVSFQTSTSFGFYKDVRQRDRLPFYTSWAYQGLHERGIETSFQILLSNDFALNNWRAQPSYASVVIPLSRQQSSRMEAGRTLWAEGFDLTLLDGVQLPYHFTDTFGLYVYGGATRSLDLFEVQSGNLIGASVFEEISHIKLRTGWMGRDVGAKRQNIYFSAFRDFPTFFLKPALLAKQEWNAKQGDATQFLGEATFFLDEVLSFSGGYSYREPRTYSDTEAHFVYHLFSNSPQQTQEYSLNWQTTQSLRTRIVTRFSAYSNGIRDTKGEQQDLYFDWKHGRGTFTPGIGHLRGGGGDVVSYGLKVDYSMTDSVSWFSELATAHIQKTNQSRGWATHVRTGINSIVASHTSLLAWFELERNRFFDFDGRVMGYVTQYF